MSLNCQLCGQYLGTGCAPIRKVVEVRPVKYETQLINDKGKPVGQSASTGLEISREINICANCAKQNSGAPQQEQTTKLVKSTSLREKRRDKKFKGGKKERD